MLNFDAKVTLATTLTQFETNMGIPSSMILSRVKTTVDMIWKVQLLKNLETTNGLISSICKSTMHKVAVQLTDYLIQDNIFNEVCKLCSKVMIT